MSWGLGGRCGCLWGRLLLLLRHRRCARLAYWARGGGEERGSVAVSAGVLFDVALSALGGKVVVFLYNTQTQAGLAFHGYE